MSKKTTVNTAAERWTRLGSQFYRDFPNLSDWWLEVDDFRELRLKARDDGTIIVVAKGYGPDGGPVVAFGVGYDPILALMAIEATLAAGHWRYDKPWESKTK